MLPLDLGKVNFFSVLNFVLGGQTLHRTESLQLNPHDELITSVIISEALFFFFFSMGVGNWKNLANCIEGIWTKGEIASQPYDTASTASDDVAQSSFFNFTSKSEKGPQGCYFVLPSHKAPYHKIWLRQTFCSSSWGRLCLRSFHQHKNLLPSTTWTSQTSKE